MFFFKGLFLYINILPVCVYSTVYVPGAYKSKKRTLDILDLEVQMVVSYHVGTERRIFC